MDTFTHALLGATVAAAVAPKDSLRKAALAGALAGALPDIDTLVTSASDPFFGLYFHRHATHSLFVIPLGALAAALFIRFILRSSLPLSRAYLYCLLGYASHSLLDLCTSYGTHFFWPLSDGRVSWDVISIVDPLVFFLLIATLSVAARRKSGRAARIGLALFLCYLCAGALLHDRARRVLEGSLAAQGKPAERLRVMPTLGNLILWRGVYESGEDICADGVRVSLWGQERVYPGACTPRFTGQEPLPLQAQEELARFSHFSDGYLARVPDEPRVLGDMRYSLLPNSLVPLWGLSLPEEGRTAGLVHFRGFNATTWKLFSGMLKNRADPAAPDAPGLWKGWAVILKKLTSEAGGPARAEREHQAPAKGPG